VLGMVDNECSLAIPTPLKDIIEKTFLQFYDNYINLATNKQHFQGQALQVI
jgi:hypothetical protein